MQRALTNHLGDELQRWCKAHGVTQSAAAMKLGVSASHLNQIIHGRVRPSADLIRRIRELMSARTGR
jgi:transcriptional regulator with XRE-family HTH domain